MHALGCCHCVYKGALERVAIKQPTSTDVLLFSAMTTLSPEQERIRPPATLAAVLERPTSNGDNNRLLL